MIILIDGDLITYPCAAASEGDPEDIAVVRADSEIRRILYELGSEDYSLYIRGFEKTYRYNLYPNYKANRAGKPPPKHLEAVREYLIRSWNAFPVEGGLETDDRLGIEATRIGLDSCIASFDKDLLQVPGWHYNFKQKQRTFVSPFDALRNFYKQVIAGDGADNVPSFDGKIRNTIPKFIQALQKPLDDMTEEEEMWNYCYSLFKDYADATLNAQVLYILREEDQYWKDPKENQNSNLPWNTEPQSSSQDQTDTKQ